MKLITALLLTAFTFQAHAWGENITKVAINDAEHGMDPAMAKPCMSDPLTESPCFHKVASFSSLNLKEHGQWNTAPDAENFIKSFSPDTLATLQEYPDFSIESLSVDGAGHFMANIKYKYGPDYQKNIVFGNIGKSTASTDLNVEVTAYADTTPDQEARRFSIKSFENIVVNRRNFQSVVSQVRMEDLRRVKVVEPIVRQTFSAMRSDGMSLTTSIAFDKR